MTNAASTRLLVVSVLSGLALILAMATVSYEVLSRRADARQACEQQAAGVEILRLFLTDHEDIRTEVPPLEDHPETLLTIDRLLDEADCQPE